MCTIALWFAGCGFNGSQGGTPPLPDAGHHIGPDAGPPDASQPGPDAGPLARRCASTDPSLRLCLDFEDPLNPGADASGRGHQIPLADGLTTINRGEERAVMMTNTSRLLVAEHADFDIQRELTVSLWLSPGQQGQRMWLFDNNRQYAISYLDDGRIRCIAGSDVVDSATSIADTGWHHVACTYDGDELVVHVDGAVAGCRELERDLSTEGAEGIGVGANLGAGPTFTERFVGGLDNVQVFARTWSSAQLCAAAGRTGCNAECPNAGDDD